MLSYKTLNRRKLLFPNLSFLRTEFVKCKSEVLYTGKAPKRNIIKSKKLIRSFFVFVCVTFSQAVTKSLTFKPLSVITLKG